MFPTAEGHSGATVKKQALLDRKAVFYGAIIIASALIVALVLIIVTILRQPSVSIPKAITQNSNLPIYLPDQLPGNYKLDEGSFDLAEKNSVLIFVANDGAGSKLFFSEQQKPRDFDFNDFYRNQLKETKTLNNVPYPSVWGKTADNRLALSVVTEDTWIVLATSAPLNESDLQKIVNGLHKN